MPLDVCMQAQSQLENHYSTYEQRTLSYHLPFVSNQRLITKETSPVCVCVAACMVNLKRSPNKCFIYKIKTTEKNLICTLMMLSETGRGLNYESMPNWRPVQSAPCLSPYGSWVAPRSTGDIKEI